MNPKHLLDATPTYRLEVPGLAQAVARCTPAADHRELLRCLQAFEPLGDIKLATTRSDRWLSRRKVLAADGALVHDDHEAWLRQQLELDGGDAGRTWQRLKGEGFLLTRCAITRLYLVQGSGNPDPAAFLQAEVDVEDEWVDRRLFTKWPLDPPSDLRDLLSMEGDELMGDGSGPARRPFRGMSYRLRQVIDMAAFVDAAETLEAQRRLKLRARKLLVTDVDTGAQKWMTQDDLAPGWDRQPGPARRLFNDWMLSSAGRSGERLCDHWVMQTADHTGPSGERSMTLVPAWTFGPRLAKIDARRGSAYELFGKLEKLDRRVKVPFGWYFFMLHGNRVDAAAGERVLKAAEAGLIALPEHDWRVLKAWQSNPYGF